MNLISKGRTEIGLLTGSLKNKGSFSQNLSYVLIAKVAIIVIIVITTPLLTRLYSPEAYGYFSFFNVLAVNFATFGSLGFATALVLCRTEREFYNLFIAIAIITLALFIPAAITFIFLSDIIVPFELGDAKNFYIGTICVGSLLFAWMQIFPRWNVWRGQFQKGAVINVMVNGSSRVMSLAIGFFYSGNHFGIIIGEIFGKIIGLMAGIQTNLLKELSSLRNQIKTKYILTVLRRFKNHPRYILSGTYLVALSSQLPVLLFPFVFDVVVLGNYSLAVGLLAIPHTILVQPLSSVLVKKFVELKSEGPEKIPEIITRLINAIFLLTILPYSVIVVFSPALFQFAFGDQWLMAGQFASILGLFGMLELAQSSLQSIFQVFDKERVVFRFSLFQLALVVILSIPGFILGNPFYVAGGIVTGRVISSTVILHKILRLCRISPWSILMRPVVVFLALTGFLYLVISFFK